MRTRGMLLSILLVSGSLLCARAQEPVPQQATQQAPAQQPQALQPSPPATNTRNAPALTLRQAEEIALKNHPEVQSSQYASLASQQMVREQLSSYYPTVYGSITGTVADRDTRLGSGYITTSALYNKFGQGVTVDQLITDSGRTPNLVASARLQARAAEQNLQATKYDVLLAVNHAFFEAQRAQALEKVAEQTLAERQVVDDQVRALVKNNLKSTLDQSFAEVNLAQARLLLITTQNNISKAFAELTRVLGSDKLQTYNLQDEPVPGAPPDSSDSLVAQAMTDRPELASLSLGRDAAYKFEKAERDLALPTVEAVGVAGALPVIEQLTPPRLTPDHYEAAAVNVNIPVFNGHLFAARRTAAMMRARGADQDLRNEQERIALDVRNAWADAATAYQKIAETEALVNNANLALALAQGRYNLGLSSIVELNQAQLGQTEAQIENVNAKFDYQTANAALQYQAGALR
jgi:outer membrane protein